MNKPINISIDEFTKSFMEGNVKGYIKKPKSWKRTHIWWEDNDKWFINIARDLKNKGDNASIEDSVWITANDLSGWLSARVREGYNFYLCK